MQNEKDKKQDYTIFCDRNLNEHTDRDKNKIAACDMEYDKKQNNDNQNTT